MLMPHGAILVDEGATNGPPIFEATKGARAHDYLNPVNGGAIGGGLPMALGAAIACPDRKVIHLQADGSGMYTVQALWSMAREKADVVIVLPASAFPIFAAVHCFPVGETTRAPLLRQRDASGISEVTDTSVAPTRSAIQSSAASAVSPTRTMVTFDAPGDRIGREPFETTKTLTLRRVATR